LDRPTIDIYTLSLHDALPICQSFLAPPAMRSSRPRNTAEAMNARCMRVSHMTLLSAYCCTFMKTCSRWIEEMATMADATLILRRSEEHTSELQSLTNLVCRLL